MVLGVIILCAMGIGIVGNLGAGVINRTMALRWSLAALAIGPGENVFTQGERHNGIFLIEQGRVRTYYIGPSGKELTLAYWTPGHFVGGPEVFGGGVHMWSAVTMEQTRLAHLPGHAVRHLAGHEHVAPERKKDPGPGFDWSALQQALGWTAEQLPNKP